MPWRFWVIDQSARFLIQTLPEEQFEITSVKWMLMVCKFTLFRIFSIYFMLRKVLYCRRSGNIVTNDFFFLFLSKKCWKANLTFRLFLLQRKKYTRSCSLLVSVLADVRNICDLIDWEEYNVCYIVLLTSI